MSLPQSRVLIVDDSRVLCLSVEGLLGSEQDIVCRSVMKAKDSMEAAIAFGPTVILQDLIMPDVEDLEMISLFKNDPRTCEIPLVMLSSNDDPKVKSDSFAAGANDYIVKLPDRLELLARVRYHSKAYQALLERNRAYEQIAADLKQAGDYVSGQLPDEILKGNVQARYLFVPCAGVGGDFFSFFPIDKDHFGMYLLDVSGHGVGSCLLSVSVGDSLRRRILPGADFHNPGQVLEVLSNIYPMDPKTGKYFTIWYGVFHRKSRELTYAGAGHPPALLMRAGAETMEELESTGPFIGIEGMPYENSKITLGTKDRIYLFSDGVYEIRDHETGRMWEFDRLKRILAGGKTLEPKARLENLLQSARQSQGSDVLEDDFAIVEFEF
ncbi:MAG: PP2C family protein-serine/threonine phosphatase [bacterium]